MLDYYLKQIRDLGVWGVRVASVRGGKPHLLFSASAVISYGDSDDSSL